MNKALSIAISLSLLTLSPLHMIYAGKKRDQKEQENRRRNLEAKKLKQTAYLDEQNNNNNFAMIDNNGNDLRTIESQSSPTTESPVLLHQDSIKSTGLVIIEPSDINLTPTAPIAQEISWFEWLSSFIVAPSIPEDISKK